MVARSGVLFDDALAKRGLESSHAPSSPLLHRNADEPTPPPGGLETVVVGGIATVRATRRECAQQMAADCHAARSGDLAEPKVVVSSNGSVIAGFHLDSEFRSLILQADMVDADGMSLVMATRLFCRKPLAERVATTDFIHDAAEAAVWAGLRFYFLGGKPGVAQRAADALRALYPGLQIVGARHGYFAEDEEEAICEEIRRSGADVLWVGLGSPRQESFAIANRSRLGGVGWIRTCGGLFDHCSGAVRRAPLWMQNIGLEWLFRAAIEPTRLAGRYLKTSPIAAVYLAVGTRD